MARLHDFGTSLFQHRSAEFALRESKPVARTEGHGSARRGAIPQPRKPQ